jgi:transcriptional regulator with XRE-family HTH domain
MINGIGKRIKQIRLNENLSQADFALKLGVKQSNLSHMEGGGKKIPLEILHKIISNFNNYNIEWILLGTGEILRTDISQPGGSIGQNSKCEKCLEKDELIKVMRITIDTQKELIDCLQTLKENCKQSEKKNQTSSEFPNLPANL